MLKMIFGRELTDAERALLTSDWKPQMMPCWIDEKHWRMTKRRWRRMQRKIRRHTKR